MEFVLLFFFLFLSVIIGLLYFYNQSPYRSTIPYPFRQPEYPQAIAYPEVQESGDLKSSYANGIFIENDRNQALNNHAVLLIMVNIFILLFLFIGTFLHYYQVRYTIEKEGQSLVILFLFFFIPFAVFFASLLVSIKAYKVQYPLMLPQDPGYRFRLESTLFHLLENPKAKETLEISKLADLYHALRWVNDQKQKDMSYGKILLITGFFVLIPLIIWILKSYF